jgi:hypothetical protein
MMRWPPRSPDLIPCGFIKDRVFVPPLSATLIDLRTRVTAAITAIDHDILQKVWHILDYRLHVCCVTGGAFIEYL